MTAHIEITYIFYLPKDYDELKQFEAENDLSKYKKTEDTIATRYKCVSDISYKMERIEE